MNSFYVLHNCLQYPFLQILYDFLSLFCEIFISFAVKNPKEGRVGAEIWVWGVTFLALTYFSLLIKSKLKCLSKVTRIDVCRSI